MKSITNSIKKEAYIAPDIEVVEIEIEQSILAGGSIGDMPGEDW